MGIPFGKRCNFWITFENKDIIMLLLDPKNNIIIQKHKNISFSDVHSKWQYGTLFCGTMTTEVSHKEPAQKGGVYVIEDIVTYKGIDVTKRSLIDRFGFIMEFMNAYKTNHGPIVKVAKINKNANDPFLYKTYKIKQLNVGEDSNSIIEQCATNVATNVATNGATNVATNVATNKRYNKHKPQYKLPTIFKVKARNDEDIYELYAYDGSNGGATFYAIAGINDYKTSVMMNSIFRNVRENRNIDYIEMSDDEDNTPSGLMSSSNLHDQNGVGSFSGQSLENTLRPCMVSSAFSGSKDVLIECTYNAKFGKWMPIKVAKGNVYVNIFKL
jgi:hypothetical protein